MRHKNRCVTGCGVDNPKNWMPLDERSFVKVFTAERLLRMIGDDNPKERKSGIKLLCDKINILEDKINKKKDSKGEYGEFKKCLTVLIDIVSDPKNDELRKIAVETVDSLDLLKALLQYPLPKDTKKAVEKKIEKLKA